MGAPGQGRPQQRPPAPAGCCPWWGPPPPAPSSAAPQGRPGALGTGAPGLGSPGRGGGRWAAARTGCEAGGRARAAPGSGPRCGSLLSPSDVRPAGRPRWRSGCPGPHGHHAEHRKRKGRAEGCRGRGQVWVPAGWSGFQGSVTPRGPTVGLRLASGRRVGPVGAAERGFWCQKLCWLCILVREGHITGHLLSPEAVAACRAPWSSPGLSPQASAP